MLNTFLLLYRTAIIDQLVHIAKYSILIFTKRLYENTRSRQLYLCYSRLISCLATNIYLRKKTLAKIFLTILTCLFDQLTLFDQRIILYGQLICFLQTQTLPFHIKHYWQD